MLVQPSPSICFNFSFPFPCLRLISRFVIFPSLGLRGEKRHEPCQNGDVDVVALSGVRRSRYCGLPNTLWRKAHDRDCSDSSSWLQELWLALTTSRQQTSPKRALITWLGRSYGPAGGSGGPHVEQGAHRFRSVVTISSNFNCSGRKVQCPHSPAQLR